MQNRLVSGKGNIVRFICLGWMLFLNAINGIGQNIYPAEIDIYTKPNLILFDTNNYSQNLNFDFFIVNKTSDSIGIASIQVSVLDKRNKLSYRKVVNTNGDYPSIESISIQYIAPNDSAVLYNPFYSFTPDIELHQLNYEFYFYKKNDEERYYREVFFPQIVKQFTVYPKLYQTKTSLSLPVKGKYIIYDGHDYYSHHRRFNLLHPYTLKMGVFTNPSRYSLDFCKVNDSGTMFTGDPSVNKNWLGFGEDLYATADGVVVAVIDSMKDNHITIESDMKVEPKAIYGNYIVIDHLNGEYSMYGHIKNGSGKVRPGQKVKRGQVIAAIGASGSSLMPHLHYELVSSNDYFKAESLPVYFQNFFKVRGSTKIFFKRGMLDSGELLLY